MGRMRIKKKDAVIPFRETLAYRMIFAGICALVLIFALYFFLGAISTNLTVAIVAGAIATAAVAGIFYNLDQMRSARVPKRTLDRMKRR
jgi:ABC-type amino acid transport system permease subunit